VPKSIGSFFLSFGVKTKGVTEGVSKLKQGLRKAEGYSNEFRRRFTSNLGNAFKMLAAPVLGAFAGAAIIKGLKNVANFAATIGDLSDQTGESTQKLTDWVLAVNKTGGSTEGFISTYKTLSRVLGREKLEGHSMMSDTFKTLGIHLRYPNQHWKSPLRILKELADRFKAIGPVASSAAASRMGMSPGVLELLLQGHKAINKQLEKEEENLKVTHKQTVAIRDIQAKMIDLDTGAKGIGLLAISESSGVISKALGLLQKLEGSIKKNRKEILGWGATIASVFGSAIVVRGAVKLGALMVSAVVGSLPGMIVAIVSAVAVGAGLADRALAKHLKGMKGGAGKMALTGVDDILHVVAHPVKDVQYLMSHDFNPSLWLHKKVSAGLKDIASLPPIPSPTGLFAQMPNFWGLGGLKKVPLASDMILKKQKDEIEQKTATRDIHVDTININVPNGSPGAMAEAVLTAVKGAFNQIHTQSDDGITA
jgi:hypothetical protein